MLGIMCFAMLSYLTVSNMVLNAALMDMNPGAFVEGLRGMRTNEILLMGALTAVSAYSFYSAYQHWPHVRSGWAKLTMPSADRVDSSGYAAYDSRPSEQEQQDELTS